VNTSSLKYIEIVDHIFSERDILLLLALTLGLYPVFLPSNIVQLDSTLLDLASLACEPSSLYPGLAPATIEADSVAEGKSNF